MTWVAVNCPQCSAPLPRVAIWRSVKCSSCGALVTRTESMVKRETFHQALMRARHGFVAGIQCGGADYQLIERLEGGEMTEVYLAKRTGVFPLLVTLELSSASSAPGQYAREAQALRELHASLNGLPASQWLPVVVSEGAVKGGARHALVTQYVDGYWGSLSALNARFPQGIDPRHAVWIWRRVLGTLQVIHTLGWSHGGVSPEHALVHPANHGVRLIGWASAKRQAGAEERAKDLQRSARVAFVLLSGANASGMPDSVPTQLAQLVATASQDEAFCRAQGAMGLDHLLLAAAQAAYGAPAFVPLIV